jgi:hypothetical protein
MYVGGTAASRQYDAALPEAPATTGSVATTAKSGPGRRGGTPKTAPIHDPGSRRCPAGA